MYKKAQNANLAIRTIASRATDAYIHRLVKIGSQLFRNILIANLEHFICPIAYRSVIAI